MQMMWSIRRIRSIEDEAPSTAQGSTIFPIAPLPPPYPHPRRRFDPDAYVITLDAQYPNLDRPCKQSRGIEPGGVNVGLDEQGVAGAAGEDEHLCSPCSVA
jgi:hypothetical protein